MARRSAYSRLIDHFHTHPNGRRHEILFWSGIGVLLGVLTLVGWRQGVLNDAFALLLGVVALCFVLWSFLPQKKVAPPKVPKGKRGEIAKQVMASKAEKKRKRGPPGPPMR